ncbi:MAG: HDOD domain-containing protein [Candidatus Sumerlaeia bacterium]
MHIADALDAIGIKAIAAEDLRDAILRLKNSRYDMMICESVVDGNRSGLSLLAEAHKRLPNMMRVVLETAPIKLSMHAMINEVAPTAIFPGKIEARKIQKLLEPEEKSLAAIEAPDNSGDNGKADDGLSGIDLVDLITDISMEMNVMMEDPNISLPVMPEIAMQVRDLMVDESNTFEKVADLVELEQGMSARILQVANSPIYAGLERIKNLQQAVGRLGLRETRNILQAVIAQNLFQTEMKSLYEILKSLWLHSICTAYCNENIAQTLDMENSEDFFMMGLLHDIGRLLVLHLIEVGRRKGSWGDRVVNEAVIRKLMAMRHHDLGARLLEKWNYPASFQDVIRLHDDDVNIHTRPEPVVVTYYSNILTRKLGFSLVPYEGNPLSNRQLAEALNMDSKTRDALEEQMRVVTDRIQKSCFAEV